MLMLCVMNAQLKKKKRTCVNEFLELFYLKSEKRKFNAIQRPCQERGELRPQDFMHIKTHISLFLAGQRYKNQFFEHS